MKNYDFFGMDLKSLKIRCADDRLEDAVALLQDYLFAKIGVRVDEEKDGGTICLRIDPDLSREKYSVSSTDAELLISGGSFVAVEEAVKEIANGKGREAVDFTGESTIPVTMTDLRGREMELVWHDEFDSDTLNPKNWQLRDRMFGGDSVVSTTAERNFMLKDGKAIMRSWKKKEGNYSTHTTLTSTGRMSFIYGYIEIGA